MGLLGSVVRSEENRLRLTLLAEIDMCIEEDDAYLAEILAEIGDETDVGNEHGSSSRSAGDADIHGPESTSVPGSG